MIRACATLLLSLALCACDSQAQAPVDAVSASNPQATMASTTTPATVETTPETTADPATTAAYVLPGDFAPDTGVGQLALRFGKDNVRIGAVPGAEGEKVDGVVLFPDDPARRAYLYFEDAEHVTGLSMVRVLDDGSRWRLDNGIGIGTSLSEVLRLNGKPIRFFGLDWDYGGAITDWSGGRLDPANDAIRRGVNLGARADIGDKPYPTGDGEFASDDPKYPDLGSDLVVDAISVSFPGEDDL